MKRLLAIQVGLVVLGGMVILQGCSGMSSGSKAQPAKVVDGSSTGKLPVGKSYAAVPPKLVREKVSWGKGKSGQSVAWDNTKRFGPVPQNLVKEGMATCKAVGGNRARGYHPRAVSVNGRPIPGGGFLCA